MIGGIVGFTLGGLGYVVGPLGLAVSSGTMLGGAAIGLGIGLAIGAVTGVAGAVAGAAAGGAMGNALGDGEPGHSVKRPRPGLPAAAPVQVRHDAVAPLAAPLPELPAVVEQVRTAVDTVVEDATAVVADVVDQATGLIDGLTAAQR